MFFGEKLPLDKFDFISFSVLEVMRSPLAPTVYRRSRQQRGVVPPVFYISHAVTILTQKCTYKSKNLEFLVQMLHCTETLIFYLCCP